MSHDEESAPSVVRVHRDRTLLAAALAGLVLVAAGIAYAAWWYDPNVRDFEPPREATPTLLERTYAEYRVHRNHESDDEYCARATDWYELPEHCRIPSEHADPAAVVRWGDARYTFSYPLLLVAPDHPWGGLGDTPIDRELGVPISVVELEDSDMRLR